MKTEMKKAKSALVCARKCPALTEMKRIPGQIAQVG